MSSRNDLADIQRAVDDYGRNHWLKKKVYLNLETKPWHAPRMAAVCAEVRGNEILDVACASGELTEKIRLAARPRRIVGLEGCREVLEFGKARYPRIEFIHGLVENMPFGARSFDAVHAGEIIEHVTDPCSFAKRLAEITRDILVVTTPWMVVRDPGHRAIFTAAALYEMFTPLFRGVRVWTAGRTWIVICRGPR